MDLGQSSHGRTSTERLDLAPPTGADIDGWFSFASDPRLWRHLPSGRPAHREDNAATVQRITDEWNQIGLGTGTVRRSGQRPVIGHGGCSLRRNSFWNLSHRLAVEAHGEGLATELAAEAVRRAHRTRPDAPVLALVLEHDVASAAVAKRTGLTLRYRGPDAGNPDPTATRLV